MFVEMSHKIVHVYTMKSHTQDADILTQVLAQLTSKTALCGEVVEPHPVISMAIYIDASAKIKWKNE